MPRVCPVRILAIVSALGKNQPMKRSKAPLSVTHPELAKQASGWDAKDYVAGSNKRLSWKCSNGHTWETFIQNRTRKGQGCPYCSGVRISVGVNDLGSTHPLVAVEADGWDPQKFRASHELLMNWKCPKGHEYQARIADRIKWKKGCLVCSGRNKTLTDGFPSLAAEADGWDPAQTHIGSKQVKKWKCSKGHSFRATVQKRTSRGDGCPYCYGRYPIVGETDLETLNPNLAKEWHPTLNRELTPKEFTASSGKKLWWLCKEDHAWEAVISNRSKGFGCPICANQKVLSGWNDLATKDPELVVSWHPTKNGSLRPSAVISGSGRLIWWKCEAGHEWQRSAAARKRNGCPYCYGRYPITGETDLLTTDPELARCWHPTKNGKLDPSLLKAHSGRSVWWLCEAGHEWKSTVDNRSNGYGCPSCAITGFDPNKKAWLYFLSHPDWEMFQIGITNNPDNRLESHRGLGWEALEIRGPMDGHLTQQWETAILRMLKATGADLSNSKIAGKFDGYSEAWSQSTFQAKSIKELMQLTEEYEESGLKIKSSTKQNRIK